MLTLKIVTCIAKTDLEYFVCSTNWSPFASAQITIIHHQTQLAKHFFKYLLSCVRVCMHACVDVHVPLCISGCLETHYINQADLELICLPNAEFKVMYLFVPMSVYHVLRYPRRPENSVRCSSWSGVTGSCELTDIGTLSN